MEHSLETRAIMKHLFSSAFRGKLVSKEVQKKLTFCDHSLIINTIMLLCISGILWSVLLYYA